jgi:hypothetical protein
MADNILLCGLISAVKDEKKKGYQKCKKDGGESVNENRVAFFVAWSHCVLKYFVVLTADGKKAKYSCFQRASTHSRIFSSTVGK